MPLFHCTECHHEWECVDKESKCDWCGAPGKVLEDKTPMEKLNWGELVERFKTLSEESVKTGEPIIITTQKKKRKENRGVN